MRKVIKIRWTKRRSKDAMRGMDIGTLSINEEDVALITSPLSKEEIRDMLLEILERILDTKEKPNLELLASEPNVDIYLLED